MDCIVMRRKGKGFKIYGVQIDLSNSNPATSVTYTDDAVGMTAGSPLWDKFFGHKPCLFKDGAVVGYLNPNNFAQFENGSAADITSGNAGDVMIEFPRRGLIINTVGNILTIKMTDNPEDPIFEYKAHTRGTISKEKFYLGAYEGYEISSKLRSISGQKPTTRTTFDPWRVNARANGSGYELSAIHQLTYRQCMYLLKYKNLNSQTAVGRGYVDGNTASLNTGGTDAKGMDFGETTGKLQMKLFGIEDFWGNLYEIVDGVITNASRNILVTPDNSDLNTAGTGYTSSGTSAELTSYMSKPYGNNLAGFIPSVAGGSATTYFCDLATLYANGMAYHGGAWALDNRAGIFMMELRGYSGMNNTTVTARLMYL